jgi:quinol monooxygenase YgiN
MSQEKVTVLAYFELLPGKEAEFMPHLHKVVAATRQEEACLNYDFHQSVDEPTKFVFYENWTSLAGLNQHGASAHIAEFRAAFKDLVAKPVAIKLFKMVTEPVG